VNFARNYVKNNRKVELVVLSDVHLGTYGCHAEELLKYLKSIQVETLVLNGDIIDMWNFSKSYFPAAHMNVLRHIIKMLANGTKVYYITGNHDEALRKYTDLVMGDFELVDKLVLELDGNKTWIFHGDVFDSSTKGYAKIIAKIGGKGYDLLILINSLVNWFLVLLGKEKRSFSKAIKDSVKKAVSFISNFEATAAEIAIEKKYSHVVCGHIHKPQMKQIDTENGSVMYLNSGDWVENLTALEYHAKTWRIYQFNNADFIKENTSEDNDNMDIVAKILQE
jgi:UDP-2,3-diacylglucosamine pyrophosphatase LpxH